MLRVENERQWSENNSVGAFPRTQSARIPLVRVCMRAGVYAENTMIYGMCIPRITSRHLAWKISGVHSRGCTGKPHTISARKRINVNGRCGRKRKLLLSFSVEELSPRAAPRSSAAKRKYRRCNFRAGPVSPGNREKSPPFFENLRADLRVSPEGS